MFDKLTGNFQRLGNGTRYPRGGGKRGRVPESERLLSGRASIEHRFSFSMKNLLGGVEKGSSKGEAH